MEVVNVLTQRLKLLMQEHRIRAAPLARAAELNESAVRDILRGRSKNPGIVTLQKIAAVLDLRPSALFEAGALWPIVGTVGGGGRVSDSSEPSFMENPFFALTPEGLSALRVEDDSLAPFAFVGDHLIFEQSPESGTHDDLDDGRPRFCMTDGGHGEIRIVKPEHGAGSVSLLPMNPYAPAERNVRLKSTHAILFVIPASFGVMTTQQTHHSSSSVHETQSPFTPKI